WGTSSSRPAASTSSTWPTTTGSFAPSTQRPRTSPIAAEGCGRWKSSGRSSGRRPEPQRLQALASRAPRLVEDARIPEQLILRVRGLREGIELEGHLPSGHARIELAGGLRLLHGMLEVREPGADHVLDLVADRAGPVVELRRRGGEGAGTRKDLPLRVVDHVVAERPHTR